MSEAIRSVIDKRKRTRVSQEDLAARMGLRQEQLSAIETLVETHDLQQLAETMSRAVDQIVSERLQQ